MVPVGESMGVSVSGLTVEFPSPSGKRRALDDVSLEIAAGEHVALVGPSGSGKTTLLRAILGGVRPTSGAVTVGGVDPGGPRRAARELLRATGIVRQGGDLVLALTGRVNALMGTSNTWGSRGWFDVLRGRVPSCQAARLQSLAVQHGVDGCLDHAAATLSGGQRQRIAIVRAMLPGPQLLLADEPTNGLDIRLATTAIEAMRGVASMTLILSTHDLSIAGLFSRVIGLRNGRIAYDGPLQSEVATDAIYGAVGA